MMEQRTLNTLKSSQGCCLLAFLTNLSFLTHKIYSYSCDALLFALIHHDCSPERRLFPRGRYLLLHPVCTREGRH